VSSQQQRVEKCKRADQSAKSDPDCDPSAGRAGARGRDLRPTAFTPRGPIACPERGKQWHEVAERDNRQRDRERTRIRARRIFYLALHSRRINPSDVIPERNRDTDGQTADSTSALRRERLPWNVSDARRTRDRHARKPSITKQPAMIEVRLTFTDPRTLIHVAPQ